MRNKEKQREQENGDRQKGKRGIHTTRERSCGKSMGFRIAAVLTLRNNYSFVCRCRYVGM